MPAYPHGSSLNDPSVQAAMRGVAAAAEAAVQREAAQPPQAPPPFPHGSSYNDPRVQSALQRMGGDGAPPCLCTVKNALNGGELAPDMGCRYDLPRYQLGSELLLNMVPMPGGGLTKRPGFQFVSGTGGGDAARLVPFTYSARVALMLMFLANSGGGQVYVLSRDGREGAQASAVVPYKASELPDVCFCQCGKILYIAHPNHPPAKLVYDGSSFTYQKLNFRIATPTPSIASLQIYGEPSPQWTTKHYKVTAVSDRTGEESLASAEMSIDASALTSLFHVIVTVNPVPGCSEYRVYKKKGGEYGFIGRITEGNDFHDDGISPDTLDPPPADFTGFGGPGDYPAIVFLHQQRLGWAASDNDPLTVWMSQTSNYECMAAKVPPADDDAIEATLASAQANRILWAVSDRSGLAIGTEGEEWYLTGGDGAGISPNSLSFQPQTRYGTQAGLDPARANASLLFVQRGGTVVRDLGYSYAADRYEAQDLTLLSRHVFRGNPIVDWCWQGSPHNILWCVQKNGKLAALTYMPEHEVAAWHRHETDGAVMSCATLDDTDGVSRLWLVVRRAEGIHVEIMRGFYCGGDVGAWFTDGQAAHEYKARCIPCLPEAGMQNGSTVMRVKKINAVKARVISSRPFACRVVSQNAEPTRLMPVPAKSGGANARLARLAYADAADWACPIGAGFRDGAKLELVMDGPDPVTILGLAIDMEVAAQSGGQV